tara:strand:+ start:1172 stop:1354 length:183 start_codon:yes stop_codon:yes gene_type:complete
MIIIINKCVLLIIMSLLKIILQLLVFVFNKLSPEEKRIFYEINNKYQIEMNVTRIALLEQ